MFRLLYLVSKIGPTVVEKKKKTLKKQIRKSNYHCIVLRRNYSCSYEILVTACLGKFLRTWSTRRSTTLRKKFVYRFPFIQKAQNLIGRRSSTPATHSVAYTLVSFNIHFLVTFHRIFFTLMKTFRFLVPVSFLYILTLLRLIRFKNL